MDHCNEVVPILEPTISSIAHLYHSGNLDSYDAKVFYKGETTMKTKEFLVKMSKTKNRVSINSGEKEKSGSGKRKAVVAVKTDGNLADIEYKIDETAKTVKILDENPQYPCEIFLIASEVSPENQADDKEVKGPDTRQGTGREERDRYAKPLHRGFGELQNSGSIVTLIKANGKKILLCGDATYATEIFLLKNHEKLISKVDVAQIEHHGAGTSHAGGLYVETINPMFAVASTGEHENDDNPRWRAFAKYLGLKKLRSVDTIQQTRDVQMKKDVGAHPVHSYDEYKNEIKGSVWEPYKTWGLFSTRSNGNVAFIVTKAGELKLAEKKK
jgi:hypothetical protein